ncbi:unnamed protein product [Acanthosepion pharaonis]|uniref:Uncharacterized protein n=1 Tax=Acanthosepion pharaonis TaxID=158019 RepID=A0A812BSA4_ACAPH|nr:unnamed protein product [Sepia pharaonis]
MISFRQSSLLGDQTLFFLHLFSSCPPGNYAFLLRLLEGENLLKHVVKHFLKTYVFAPSSSQTALTPNSTYGLLFKLSFLGTSLRGLLKTFSEGETCPQQLCYPCILHIWANTACLFSREREKKPLLSEVSHFQLPVPVLPSLSKRGSPLSRPITVH